MCFLFSPWFYHSRPSTFSWPAPSRSAACCQAAALMFVWVVKMEMKATPRSSSAICPHEAFLALWWGSILKKPKSTQTNTLHQSSSHSLNTSEVSEHVWVVMVICESTHLQILPLVWSLPSRLCLRLKFLLRWGCHLMSAPLFEGSFVPPGGKKKICVKRLKSNIL